LTGRLMEGHRYDDGLHQALEAKEQCAIGEETRTLAAITLQSLFSKYPTLAGMTGTALEDADEYRDVYGRTVLPIPPQRPSCRIDERSNHATRAEKVAAIIDQIEQAHARGQPVLVGTTSISHSEHMASALQSRGWTATLRPGARHFAVLNARHHEHEARIIANAGTPGAVTIATAMAGRGTDIKLGGLPENPELRQRAAAAGGLLVIATEPHDTGRLDRQLRGRAGRQGDPGRTVMYASRDDDLLQHSETAAGAPRPAVQVDRMITAVQSSNKAREYNRRRALMQFDDIVEQQRATILTQRGIARDTVDALGLVKDLRDETIDDLLQQFAGPGQSPDIHALDSAVRAILTLAIEFPPSLSNPTEISHLRSRISSTADIWMDGKIAAFGAARLSSVLRTLMMALLDQLWCEQTQRLQHLRRQVFDRRLSEQRTRTEYAAEAFAMLAFSLREFRHEVTAHSLRLGLAQTSERSNLRR
jgi:preprotein translocase subunit SecA